MPIYDDFSAPQLDTVLWNAVRPSTGFERGSFAVEVARCECMLNLSPVVRKPGELLQTVFLSTRTWEVGREPLAFSTVLAAEANADDGAACAAFGVFDAAGGTVIGIAATGTGLLAIARESGDPLAPLSDGALEFSDLGVNSQPLHRHDLKIEYDPQRRVARWYVDEVLRLYREVPFDPRELTCAFGLLPLRQFGAGDATPELRAAFGPIQWSDEGELEPDPFYSAQPG